MAGSYRHDVIAEVIKRSRTVAEELLFAKYPHIPYDAAMEQKRRKTGEPSADRALNSVACRV
jgi:hypothetical protein